MDVTSSGRIPTRLVVVTSPDGGATWTPPVLIATISDILGLFPPDRYRNASLPAFAADPRHGRLYITWADKATGDADILFSSSSDAGRTWFAPLRVNDDSAGDGANQFQPQLAVAPNGVVTISFFDTRRDATTISSMSIWRNRWMVARPSCPMCASRRRVGIRQWMRRSMVAACNSLATTRGWQSIPSSPCRSGTTPAPAARRFSRRWFRAPNRSGWRLKPRLRAAPQSLPARAAERAPTRHPVGSFPCNLRRQVSWPTTGRPFRRGFQPPAPSHSRESATSLTRCRASAMLPPTDHQGR